MIFVVTSEQYKKDPERYKELRRISYQKNIEKERERARNYIKTKYQNDPNFKSKRLEDGRKYYN